MPTPTKKDILKNKKAKTYYNVKLVIEPKNGEINGSTDPIVFESKLTSLIGSFAILEMCHFELWKNFQTDFDNMNNLNTRTNE